MKITDKLSDNLKNCLAQAQKIALPDKTVNVNHFIIALFKQKGSLAFDLLQQKQIDPIKINDFFSLPSIKNTGKQTAKISNELKDLLLQAANLARKKQHFYIGTEHCLSILLQTMPPSLKSLFATFNLQPEKLKTQVDSIMRGNSKFPELTNFINHQKSDQLFTDDMHFFQNQNSLGCFATDITDKKIQKNINPIINRDQELARLIQILCRKDKNNPVILGDAGVGKTALVEGLAKKIIDQQVPPILLNKKIFSLDLGSLIAGTMYRGDFEQRLKTVLDEIKNNPDIILFIDELQNIIGAGGSTNNALDAANILKPMLARGEIRCIGATTWEEYKKFIEKDRALERRFQPIVLEEPNETQAIEILHGIKDNYQRYHQVTFTDDAISSAVELSRHYLPDKLLPDKAIDLIDEAAAKSKIKKSQSAHIKQLIMLKDELQTLRRKKEKAIDLEKFNLALQLKKQEKIISQKIKQQHLLIEAQKSSAIITDEHIIEIVSQKTRIPASQLQQNENQKLLELPKLLKQKIIGQDKIINQVTAVINRAKLGLAQENKPLASFMFLGPSGVGKTYLAKLLAENIFFDQKAFIRIDMSEFSEKFNASKLIGAPAGYVGYRENAQLTDAVKNRPYSLVLFDEIEKAHPDITNLLLQILEEGQLADAVGRKINFCHCIIIMTSNIGSDKLNKKAQIGFGREENNDLMKNFIVLEAKKILSPELINRLDKILLFNQLTNTDIKQILKLQIKELRQKLNAKNLKFNISDSRLNDFAKTIAEMECGARGVSKILTEKIEQPIIDKFLQQKI